MDFFNQDDYYSAYQEEFSDVEFLDYSDWPVADDERYDAHHLNAKGAVRFTQELKNRFNLQ